MSPPQTRISCTAQQQPRVINRRTEWQQSLPVQLLPPLTIYNPKSSNAVQTCLMRLEGKGSKGRPKVPHSNLVIIKVSSNTKVQNDSIVSMIELDGGFLALLALAIYSNSESGHSFGYSLGARLSAYRGANNTQREDVMDFLALVV